MLYRNPTPQTLKIPEMELIIPPNAVVDIPDGYGRPRRSANGGLMKPTVLTLAPQLEAVDPSEATVAYEDILKPVLKKPSAEDFKAAGKSDGVAEILAAQAELEEVELYTPPQAPKPEKKAKK
jgi:hypothetical protein